MKVGNLNGKMERKVGTVDGRVGFWGRRREFVPGGRVVGMFGRLGAPCRRAIPKRQHTTNEDVSACVIRAIEKHECGDAN